MGVPAHGYSLEHWRQDRVREVKPPAPMYLGKSLGKKMGKLINIRRITIL